MTLSFVVMIAGLIIWFLASRVESISDAWLSRLGVPAAFKMTATAVVGSLGEIMYAVGLFWVLASVKESLY